MSLVEFRGRDEPVLYGCALQHGSCRGHHQAAEHGRVLSVPNGLLGSESADRLCPQCTRGRAAPLHLIYSTPSSPLILLKPS
ncbi:hypothetical protein Bca4012_043315 [Brassica carinata]|uniref:Uncharacterized protein n=1 Tax=Brassica carinata TaxID=52824 RepID=A0A8X7QXE6_BRACI|nr:hypothetical protein Bca52824_059015 [Brassica carinata]